MLNALNVARIMPAKIAVASFFNQQRHGVYPLGMVQ
tara:strand:+ start:483 stop:590 length:108 start_codon:yes stop_codon:yes gene_type:complete